MHPLTLESATRLAARIRSREVTSREVVEAHIARVVEVNPRINAVVKERFDDARAEADRADARTGSSTENLPPLHGVPCTIKESIALGGMPLTAGLVARAGTVAAKDATTVARLRAAGAIPLGVTNTSELCMWMETSNRVYGRTNNPYDARRIVGGSSGGEGAIVGAGGVPFGLGADIGGSIRMPAFFNGVFGHKPTGGLVPGTGQFPIAENRALRYLTTGPLCRRAEDLMPLLRLLAGPDGEDAECVPWTLGCPSAVRLDELTVLDVEDDGRTPVDEELRVARRRAVEALREQGARVEKLELPLLKHSFNIWSGSLAAAGGKTFGELLGDGQPRRWGVELGRWLARRSPHTLPAIMLALVEKLPKYLPAAQRRAVAEGEELKAELASRLGERGVLLYPPYVSCAPRHYKPMWPPFNWVYTAIFNILELPVTEVPLGLNPRGLPLGVQVAAAHGQDHLTIAVALELERRFGGWVPPPN